MKRFLSGALLLAGLSGCISPTPNPGQGGKQLTDSRGMAVPSSNGFVAQPAIPTNPTWTPHPEHGLTADALAARMNAPASGVVTANAPAGSTLSPAPAPREGGKDAGVVQASATMPSSLVPLVTTPPDAVARGGPGRLPGNLPVEDLPTAQTIPEPKARAQAETTAPIKPTAGTTPAGLPATLPAPEPVSTTSAKPDPTGLPLPEPTLNALPTPAKGAAEAEAKAKPSKVGPPLVRLVNTKRITLNFEIKDVGPSGLGNVELWYTQNCRDWKKHDAPTTSKAYVVEVDEEGMYGFTLIARSGLGLGKEPPTTGDQPQVWVIVDLTAPVVELSEVKPLADSKVAISWKASDKNFSRTPITLSYAETDAGPWRVIATNLENNGKYTWQIPNGTPPKFLVRVEAADLAGNLTQVQSSRPLWVDNKMPVVSITNVGQ